MRGNFGFFRSEIFSASRCNFQAFGAEAGVDSQLTRWRCEDLGHPWMISKANGRLADNDRRSGLTEHGQNEITLKHF